MSTSQWTEISSGGAAEHSGIGKPRIETELCQRCINNLTVTYGVKTYNCSDTSKQWLLLQCCFVQPARRMACLGFIGQEQYSKSDIFNSCWCICALTNWRLNQNVKEHQRLNLMQKQVLQLDLFYSELIMQICTECKCFVFLVFERKFLLTKHEIHKLSFAVIKIQNNLVRWIDCGNLSSNWLFELKCVLIIKTKYC